MCRLMLWASFALLAYPVPTSACPFTLVRHRYKASFVGGKMTMDLRGILGAPDVISLDIEPVRSEVEFCVDYQNRHFTLHELSSSFEVDRSLGGLAFHLSGHTETTEVAGRLLESVATAVIPSWDLAASYQVGGITEFTATRGGGGLIIFDFGIRQLQVQSASVRTLGFSNSFSNSATGFQMSRFMFDEFESPAMELTLIYPGDANSSGEVNFKDFLILSSKFTAPGEWRDGDFNSDMIVGFADFLLLAENFGKDGRGLSLPLVTTPEPSTVAMALVVMLFVALVVRPLAEKKASAAGVSVGGER